MKPLKIHKSLGFPRRDEERRAWKKNKRKIIILNKRIKKNKTKTRIK
jgi:hypothetical protein